MAIDPLLQILCTMIPVTSNLPSPGPSSTAQRSISAPVVVWPVPQVRKLSDAAIIPAPGVEKSRGSLTTVNSFTYNKAWEVEAENALKVRLCFEQAYQ